MGSETGGCEEDDTSRGEEGGGEEIGGEEGGERSRSGGNRYGSVNPWTIDLI